MIVYFSATGNSRHAALSIAARFGDDAVSAESLLSGGHTAITVEPGGFFGFVTPTYYWGLPAICAEFLSKAEISFSGEKYAFLCATYGTMTGQLAYQAQNLMASKGTPFDAFFGIKTVDNYVPLFSVRDSERIAAVLKKEEKQIEAVVSAVENRKRVPRMRDSVFFGLASGVYQKYDRKRLTKYFFVSDDCVSCGKCAELCPEGAIEMDNGRPVWRKERCTLCLGCLHRCPAAAVGYVRKNVNGQYMHPAGGES